MSCYLCLVILLVVGSEGVIDTYIVMDPAAKRTLPEVYGF